MSGSQPELANVTQIDFHDELHVLRNIDSSITCLPYVLSIADISIRIIEIRSVCRRCGCDIDSDSQAASDKPQETIRSNC